MKKLRCMFAMRQSVNALFLFAVLAVLNGCGTTPLPVPVFSGDVRGERIKSVAQAPPSHLGIVMKCIAENLEENAGRLKGIAINGVLPTYDSISAFKYPGSRPLYIYVKNAHVRAIPAIRAYVAEFAKETTWGPNGYLVRRGMIAAPDAIRARSAAAAAALTPLNPATVK